MKFHNNENKRKSWARNSDSMAAGGSVVQGNRQEVKELFCELGWKAGCSLKMFFLF